MLYVYKSSDAAINLNFSIHYTLARHYYEVAGKTADYSKLVDWTATQVLAVLAPYLEKYGKAKKADILKIVGDHVTDKQLRNFLDQLKKSEYLSLTTTSTNSTTSLANVFQK